MGEERVAERRAHARHRVVLSATVGGDAELPVGCRTVDVSMGGALLETPTLLVGEHVVVVLVLDGDGDGDGRRLIPIGGEIVAQTVDVDAGVVVARVAFRRMTQGGRTRLSETLGAASPV